MTLHRDRDRRIIAHWARVLDPQETVDPDELHTLLQLARRRRTLNPADSQPSAGTTAVNGHLEPWTRTQAGWTPARVGVRAQMYPAVFARAGAITLIVDPDIDSSSVPAEFTPRSWHAPAPDEAEASDTPTDIVQDGDTDPAAETAPVVSVVNDAAVLAQWADSRDTASPLTEEDLLELLEIERARRTLTEDDPEAEVRTILLDAGQVAWKRHPLGWVTPSANDTYHPYAAVFAAGPHVTIVT
jgi:hypothetical protein